MFGAIRTAVDNFGDQVINRTPEASDVNPGEFLQNWITDKLPEAVVGLATRIGGREDGSGFIAQQALEAGQDPNLLGGILQNNR